MLSIGIRWFVIQADGATFDCKSASSSAAQWTRDMFRPLRRSPAECMVITVASLGAVFTILQVFQMWLLPSLQYLQLEDGETEHYEINGINAPVVLWWTTSFGEGNFYRTCGDKRCYFTNRRSNEKHPLLKAILFYASDFEIEDLPIPRGKDVRWALLHEESPRNNPMFVHDAALRLFNYSATFSRYSDVPLTLDSLPGEEELLSTKHFLPVKEKNRLMEAKKLAPILYIQTDCDTASDRDSYVADLMKYIEVDSYGECLNNRKLPKSLTENYIQKLDDEDFFDFVGQYKFTLAFENAVCDDYITEKLWRPLIVGSVPIYYGSPTFEDWLPNNKSAIAAQNFPEPKDLADFLRNLDNDDSRYNEYLTHKLSETPRSARIVNDRLLSALRARPENLFSLFGHYIRELECHVCREVHTAKISTMTRRQYNCPLPKKILPRDRNKKNSWAYSYVLRKCSAKLLARHVETGEKIDTDRFEEETFLMHERNDCS